MKKRPAFIVWIIGTRLFRYLTALRAVPFPLTLEREAEIKKEAETKAAQIKKEHEEKHPMRSYMVELNTGAGMRKIYVEAHDEKEAHYTALAQYMKEYFKTRVYPAPFKNTKKDEPKGTDKK